jgi:hypothetical protein
MCKMMETLESRTLMSSAPTIYAASETGELFTLNLGNGATHNIGNMHVDMFDIALNKSNGQMYGVDSSSNLYKINKSNGKVSKVGSVGHFVNALTFSPGGTLYGAGYNDLYKISTSSGHGTTIGSLGSNQSAGDLAFDSKGNMYLTTTSNKLVKVNTSNAHTTTIGSIGYNEVYGLGFDNGVMYGLSNSSDQAFTISLSTGKGKYLSYFGKTEIGANGASF